MQGYGQQRKLRCPLIAWSRDAERFNVSQRTEPVREPVQREVNECHTKGQRKPELRFSESFPA